MRLLRLLPVLLLTAGCSGVIESDVGGRVDPGSGGSSNSGTSTTGQGTNVGSSSTGSTSAGSTTSSSSSGSGGTASGGGATAGSGSGQAGGSGSGGTGGSASDGGAPKQDGPTSRDSGLGDVTPGTGCFGALAGPPDYSRDGTGTPVPGSDANQLAALIRANHWRTPGGLTAFNANAMVQQAAAAHAHFMTINPAVCYPGSHQEVMTSGTTTCVGFTGTQPWDRMTTAGYAWRTAAEVIDSAANGTAAVDQWIWTVYHREPFLDAQYLDVGYALEGTNDVMDFAARTAASTTLQIVFPLPGQTAVKVDFNGSQEGPTPPPPATKGWPSGTVVSVTFSGAYTIVSHQLYDGACQPVVHTAHGAFDDTNAGTRYFYMFADSPLAHGVTYTASVSATIGATPWSETWSFTTQ